MIIPSIHPFPARMAPEIAFEIIKTLRPNSVLLDPMAGSGTTLRIGLHHSCQCIGADIDPLALLISKVSLTFLSAKNIDENLRVVLKRFRQVKQRYPPNWDVETYTYAKFWYADRQLMDLTKLSTAISKIDNYSVRNLFQVALSRCIITKDRGASLGRDVSHGKPHKTKQSNDFDVAHEFTRVVCLLKTKIIDLPQHRYKIYSDDARRLQKVQDASVDCIITSPPYLHAVDYFRGHRLSLIWMGYSLEQLRALRSKSIGLQVNASQSAPDMLKALLFRVCNLKSLPTKNRLHLYRYALDIKQMAEQFQRVLKRRRKATIVIANALSAGVQINNTRLIKNAALMAGFNLLSERSRVIPAHKRYLPPPQCNTNSDLENRMKTESVLTFVKH